MITKRDFCKMSAASLLTAGLWPGRLRAAENGQGAGNWTFLAVNDLHYYSAECTPWFEKVIAAMKLSAPHAEFCLLGGDLANDGEQGQLASVRDLFKTFGAPVYSVPGNHDYLNDDDRTAYDALYPGQLNQTFEHRGWQFVGLDTTDGLHFHDTAIHDSTFAWLRDNLPKLDRAKPTIIFTHFPLGEKVTNRPSNADPLLQMFIDFNLQAALSGHWHGFTEKTWRDAILTTDRCCSRVQNNHDGTSEKGWFVCQVQEGKLSRQFVEIPQELRTVR
jgi:Icc-related predicted phosphoesterase